MGHQLLALAAGARTEKMHYGNRAHNIPVLDHTTGQCHMYVHRDPKEEVDTTENTDSENAAPPRTTAMLSSQVVCLVIGRNTSSISMTVATKVSSSDASQNEETTRERTGPLSPNQIPYQHPDTGRQTKKGHLLTIIRVGLMHKTRPIFSTQFHPEAKGGPEDCAYLFDKYIESVRAYKNSQSTSEDTRPSQLMFDILSKQRIGTEPSRLAFAA
jgi:hypothetical protein